MPDPAGFCSPAFGLPMKFTLPLIACLLLAPLTRLSAADQKPNILLILSDDQSVPLIGAYGDANCKQNQLTPNLDAFAAASMRFI